MAALVAGLAVAIAVAVLMIRREPDAAGPPTRSTSITTNPTTTTIDVEAELIARLRNILRVRDRAYRVRDANLLEEIYTSDCPCLKGDRAAIQQLLRDNAVWIGASTSVDIRKLERVNDRLWIVIADFNGSPFRIETESGELIRSVEGRRELFRFALARTPADQDWLLGFAAPIGKAD